jgi:hypothetical protein
MYWPKSTPNFTVKSKNKKRDKAPFPVKPKMIKGAIPII